MVFYIFIAAVAIPAFFSKVKSMAIAIKERNEGKIKAEGFFLLLMILVLSAIIIFHEWRQIKSH